MGDRFDLDVTQSTRHAVVVTPNDATQFVSPTRGLYIGTAGAIRVLHTESSSPVTYPVTVAGYVYPWSVVRVYATGTLASDIIAQY